MSILLEKIIIIESVTKALHINYIWKNYQKNQSKCSYKIKKTVIDTCKVRRDRYLYHISWDNNKALFQLTTKYISQMYRATNFQNKYIFCGKEVKYVKRKSEFLRNCVVEQAKSNILQHAKEKNHSHLIVFGFN